MMKNKLDKNAIKNLAIFAIALVVYNVISFCVPFKHTATFWGAYAFGMLAIVLQVGVVLLATNRADRLSKKVYAFPIFRMGIIYLVVQLCVSLLLTVLACFIVNFPTWIVYVLSVIVLGVCAVFIMLTDTVRDEIVELEAEEERQTVQIKTFRINIDSILRRVEDGEIYKALVKLNDVARYSDPVSCEALYDIESEITERIGQLDTAVKNGELELAKTLTEEIIDLFGDRNARCKAFKKK